MKQLLSLVNDILYNMIHIYDNIYLYIYILIYITSIYISSLEI